MLNDSQKAQRAEHLRVLIHHLQMGMKNGTVGYATYHAALAVRDRAPIDAVFGEGTYEQMVASILDAMAHASGKDVKAAVSRGQLTEYHSQFIQAANNLYFAFLEQKGEGKWNLRQRDAMDAMLAASSLGMLGFFKSDADLATQPLTTELWRYNVAGEPLASPKIADMPVTVSMLREFIEATARSEWRSPKWWMAQLYSMAAARLKAKP